MGATARRLRVWMIGAVSLALIWILVRDGSAMWAAARAAAAASVAVGAVALIVAGSRPRLCSAVMLVDARGHGDSEGRAMDFGWMGNRDIAPAVQWLVDSADVEDDRIALVGLSNGG